MSTTFDLSTLGLSAGTHSITVKARASGYEDSDESNAVSYEVQSPTEETYTLSGTWVFNSDIDVSTVENYGVIGIYFISNGKECERIFSNNGRTLYYRIRDGFEPYVYEVDDGWINEEYRTISLVGEQIVDKETYDWFVDNATEVTVGTKTLTLDYGGSNVGTVLCCIDRLPQYKNGEIVSYDSYCNVDKIDKIKDFVVLAQQYDSYSVVVTSYKNCDVNGNMVYNIKEGASVSFYGED